MSSRILFAALLAVVGTNVGCSGDQGEGGPPGVACWDLDESGVCDPASEDLDGDGTCSAADCAGGGGGVACWDLDGNGTCDPVDEDEDGDGACTVADCRGGSTPGIACWDLDENGTCDAATEDADGDGTCSAADCAGVNLGTLSGMVTDANTDEALADVVVTLDPEVVGSALSTDAAGAFTGNIPSGAYMVTFELPGYASETVSAGVAAGLDTTLDVALTAYGDLDIPTTEEGCAVCHGPGRDQDVAAAHAGHAGMTGRGAFEGITAEQLDVTVTGITDTGAGILEIAFSMTDEAGDGVAGIGFDSNRVYISDIVPAGTATRWGTWETDYLERWAYERVSSRMYGTIMTCTTDADCTAVLGTSAACDAGECEVPYPAGTWTDLGGGDYTYRMASALGNPLAMVEAPDYSSSHVQRLVIRVDGREYGYVRAVAIQDFTVSGAAPALVAPTRVLAPVTGCLNCHSPNMNRAAHGGGYLDTRACVMCHSPLGHYGDRMQTNDSWGSVLYHKLHAAIPMPAFPDRIGGRGYGAVTFPQDIRNCTVCHNGDSGMTDAWETNPSVPVCTSCHEDVSFVTPAPAGTTLHSGGAVPAGTSGTGCTGCHSGGVAPTVEEAHTVTLAAEDVPEFDVTLSITPPATGTFYVAGETPMVTVTLANADGSTFDPAFYTTARGDAGDTSDTALRVASVYVYGPRARAVPVLATGTMHDPLHDPRTSPTQGHMMFTGGTDPLVQTDATGFKYQLLEIPEGMEPGTYIVRVRIGDYSRVGSGDYHTESIALTTIQIGTDTEEDKVSGERCVGCHGDGDFLPHNERHAATFDTDNCLACHDQSGNFAIPLANRLHAKHAANSDGDIYNIEGRSRDHSDVTFPSNEDQCTVCHSSGNTTYLTNPYMMPCAGCHVQSGNGVLSHMQSNGGPYPRP